MRTLEVVAAVVGTAVLVSCSSAPEQAAPSATLSPVAVTEAPTPTPTPTEAPIDTAKVPDEITVEYLQAVMDDLDKALASVYQEAARRGNLGEAYEVAMREVFTQYAASQQSDEFREVLGMKGLADPPRLPVTEVLELIETSADCVYFTAERDLDPLFREPIGAVQPYYIALERGTPTDRNPTAWLIAFDTYIRSGKAPRTVCGGGDA